MERIGKQTQMTIDDLLSKQSKVSKLNKEIFKIQRTIRWLQIGMILAVVAMYAISFTLGYHFGGL